MILSYSTKSMPPRQLKSKGQEHTYKIVGQGNRARFRPVPVQVPKVTASVPIASGSQVSTAPPPQVSEPTAPGEGFEYVEGGETWSDFEMPHRKGKVNKYIHVGPVVGQCMKMAKTYSIITEAVGLHEILAGGEKNEISPPNDSAESRAQLPGRQRCKWPETAALSAVLHRPTRMALLGLRRQTTHMCFVLPK